MSLNQSKTIPRQEAKKRPLGPLFEESSEAGPILVSGHPPPFSQNNSFYLCLEKNFPTGPKPFWCVNFQKLYKIKIVKHGNLLQISLLLVFGKNKNENVSKFDDSMSNYLTYNLT